VDCPNEEPRFGEGCHVSLTVFDHGDGVTHSSHCLSSPAKDTHSFGGWICCRVHVEHGKRPFSYEPVNITDSDRVVCS
jgi:hypothetical protein